MVVVAGCVLVELQVLLFEWHSGISWWAREEWSLCQLV